MITKYLATLAVVVALVTLGLSSLPFASRSKVLSGNVVDETMTFEFTLAAGGSSYYRVSQSIMKFLDDNVRVQGAGAARVLSQRNILVLPREVSWTVGRTHHTAPGGSISVDVRWDTPAGSASGSKGAINLIFPEIPDLQTTDVTFRSGGTDSKGGGVYAVREVTTYKSESEASVARFLFALWVGLPFGALLHVIGWGFFLKRERAERVAAFLPEGPGLPQTFYPNPIVEWTNWSIFLGIGLIVTCIFAWGAISDGFMGPSEMHRIYWVMGSTIAISYLIAFFTGKNVLTLRVAASGISYMRGRTEQDWLAVPWSEISAITNKSQTSKGTTTYWTVIEFNDKRKKLSLNQNLEGYGALRDLLTETYNKALAR